MNEEDTRTQLERLYDACSEPQDYKVLESLCLRAGLLWECKICTNINDPEDNMCEGCGMPMDNDGS